MTTRSPETHGDFRDANAEQRLGTSEKFLVWLFVLGFLAFGAMLIGDLILAMWR